MLKPGPTYKMSRPDKVMLASYIDRNKRGEIKRTVIQADLAGRQHQPRSRDKNQPNNS
jgi:pyrimidine operon attenuation protein/uracil phosphoribosyltransferase